ncbi:TetR/AcrR family transcriptional regulator [Ornithinimicrobium sp. Y1694]|uniref:TetR/AcrR family transcriptional regulator n=1 Tax=Ornithinimicrobium sp. Y1694 TaxID=3418590 RepID=UPI003CF9CD72
MTPPRARRPQVPMEQRRAELTEVALRVMAREGAWALTTRALAKEADVPHGSVHYAFSSKAEIVRAVIQADTDSAVQIFGAVGVDGATPGETLGRAFTAYLDRLIADPQTELVLQELTLMAVRDPELAALMAESSVGYDQSLGRLLATLAEQTGRTWDAPLPVIVEQLLGLLFGTTQAWLLHRDDERLRSALADAARLYGARLEQVAE